MFFNVNFLRHVGHFFCEFIAPWIHVWQKMWPQMVDVSSFIVSMQIAHLNLYSSSASGAGGIGATSFMKNGSTGTGFRFLEFCKKRSMRQIWTHYRPLWGTREELHIWQVSRISDLKPAISTLIATDWNEKMETIQKDKPRWKLIGPVDEFVFVS